MENGNIYKSSNDVQGIQNDDLKRQKKWNTK